MHGLVCDREVWVWLLQGVGNFSREKVKELARFGSIGSPEMKAEVVKAAARKMKPSDNFYRISIKVSVKGWGDTPDTIEVDGGAMKKDLTLLRSEHLTLPWVATTMGVSFNLVEVHCSRSISNEELILSQCADHVKQQGSKLESLELTGLPRKSTPHGIKKNLFFTSCNSNSAGTACLLHNSFEQTTTVNIRGLCKRSMIDKVYMVDFTK